MKLLSRPKKFKKNIMRGFTVAVLVFHIAALSVFASSEFTVTIVKHDQYNSKSSSYSILNGNGMKVIKCLTLNRNSDGYPVYCTFWGSNSSSLPYNGSEAHDLAKLSPGDSFTYDSSLYKYYYFTYANSAGSNKLSTLGTFSVEDYVEPTPTTPPIPVNSGLYVYNTHSTGAFPTAALSGYLDTYVGSSSTGNNNFAYSGSVLSALVYGDYNFTDSINIYLNDDSGNPIVDGIYKINVDIRVNCEFNNDGTTKGNFIFLGGFSEIIDSSLNSGYSISNFGVPADDKYLYDIHLSGEFPVINGFVGSLNIKHSLTFAYDYYNQANHSDNNGIPTYPDNQPLNRFVLPFITYVHGNTEISNDSFSLVSTSTSEITAIDKVDDTLNKQFQQDQQGATSAADQAGSFITQAKDLENKWEILWYPITFSNNVLSVFTGGTQSAAYQDSYGMVAGYEYDEETGFLKPIIDRTRSVRSNGGTTITFPAFTLPVLDVQLWDSYEFDLSTIKDGFPMLFNTLYVVETILEVYWFVGFLRDKYEEVFG